MDCKTAQKMIEPYIKKTLNIKETEKFFKHLKICPECREELEIYLSVYLALQTLDEREDISYDIQQLLRDRFTYSTHRIRRFKVFRICKYICLFLMILAFVVLLWSRMGPWTVQDYQNTYVYRVSYESERQQSFAEIHKQSVVKGEGHL